MKKDKHKMVKDLVEGGRGRFDRGQRFNFFFLKASLSNEFNFLVGWFAGLLFGWLAGWLVSWLTGWLVGWLTGWPVGWLTG